MFTFGSLPPPKPNPPTPIKNKERRPVLEIDSEEDRGVGGDHSIPRGKSQGLGIVPAKDRSAPDFVWNPRVFNGKANMMEERADQQSKRLHRSTEIPESFWNIGGFFPPSGSTLKRGRIFPILFSAADKGEYTGRIKLLTTPEEKGGWFMQISIVEGKHEWSQKEVQASILEETALALRKIIVNTHNQHNPLRVWESACWHYRWIKEETSNSAHCVIFAFIPIIANSITLQRPDNFRWILAPPVTNEILLEKIEMGQILGVEELPMHEIYLFGGKDLFEQDPSPPRPAAKRGKQEMETDMPVADLIGFSGGHPDGQPEGGNNIYTAE